jgi:hypothetical protein
MYSNDGLCIFDCSEVGQVATLKLLSTNLYTHTGKYLLILKIPQLNSGKIEIVLDGEVYYTIDEPGEYPIVYEVNSVYNSSLVVKLSGVDIDDSIKISQISLSYVKDSLTNYLEYMISYIVTGTNDMASKTDLATLSTSLSQSLTAYADNLVSQLSQVIATHISSKSNPHMITCASIDAAAREHTHSQYQDHLISRDNPHKVTKEQLGLNNLPNAISNEVGSDSTNTLATTALTHQIYSDVLNILNQHNTLRNEFILHREALGNVHGLTKNDINLGLVQNYPIAEISEAENGLINNKYMTPDRTKRLVYHHLKTDLNKPVQLCSTPISSIVVNNSSEDHQISIVPHKKYTFHLRCMNTADLSNIVFKFKARIPYATATATYLSEWYPEILNDPERLDGDDVAYLELPEIWLIDNYISIIDYTIPENIYSVSDTFPNSYIEISPNADFVNGIGKFNLDTSGIFLDGDILAYTANSEIPTRLRIIGTPIKSTLVELLANEYHISELVISSKDGIPISYELDLYETVQASTYQDFISVDANPIGTIIEVLTDTIPFGYVPMEGQILDANEYITLLTYAKDHDLVISFNEQQLICNTSDSCYRFGYTEGSSQFSMPKLISNVTKVMKAFDFDN